MSGGSILRLAGALVGLVFGQLGLKLAMEAKPERTRRRRVLCFAAGIGAMTVWFFLWMGLLGDHELSYLYPFEAVGSVVLSLAAIMILKERLTLRLSLGIALITAGVLLVSLS